MTHSLFYFFATPIRCTIICGTALLAMLPTISRSQSATFVGIEARLHDVHQSGGFRTWMDGSQPLFEDGSGFGQSLGLKLGRRISRSFGISTIVSYNNLPSTFELHRENVQGGDYEVEYMNGPIDSAERMFIYPFFLLSTEVYYKTLSVEALGEWRPFVFDSTWSIGIAAGPTLDYTIQAEMRQTLDLIEPQNARLVNPNNRPLENHGRRAALFEEEIPSARKLRAGLRAGLFAEFGNLNSGVVISPGIFFYTGLTNVTKAENWSLRTLTGQVNVMFPL